MAYQTHRVVAPINPAAPWVGGKRNLARRIVDLIDRIPHRCYAEPFVGMGGVFLRRRKAAPVEIINDAHGEVATFFRVLQWHYPQFMDTLRFMITSRGEFERLAAVDPSTLTDLHVAARFLYLQRLAYGGKVTGRTFGTATSTSGRFNVITLRPRLEELHERLAGVVIERMDFEHFLDVYDRPHTLFYLDPPYYGSERYYGRDLFSRADFDRLAAALGRLRGRFLLSINDRPEVREIFSDFEMQAVATTYSVHGKGRSKRVGELLIQGGGAHP